MLVIPKTLCQNSGFDVMDSLLAMQEEHEESGEPIGPAVEADEQDV